MDHSAHKARTGGSGWWSAMASFVLPDLTLSTDRVKAHFHLFTAGDPHNSDSFVCKRAGGLVGCRNCPRVYHSGCAGLPAVDLAVENWACPACALLGLDEAQDVPSASSNAMTEAGRSKSKEDDKWTTGTGMMNPSRRVMVKKRPTIWYSTTGKFQPTL